MTAPHLKFPRWAPPLFQPYRHKALYGGRGSAKSHTFAGRLVLRAAEEPIRWLCARETQSSIRQSVKHLLDAKIRDYGLRDFYAGSTDHELRGANGSLIFFAGLRTDPDAIKSAEDLDGAWVEEAHRCSQRSLEILTPTIRKPGSELWWSWNPESPKDPVDVLFRGPKGPPPRTFLRQVNWDENPFFPHVLLEELEWDRARDPEKYQHVWLGEYRRASEARVFHNWVVEECPEPPPGTRFYLGADFGFSVDPTVLVRCWLDPERPRRLYVDQEAWALKCEVDHTPALFAGSDERDPPRWVNPRGWSGVPGADRWPIRADSARPETISYLARAGLNVTAARKGPGSVEEGVEFLKNYDLVVDPRCRHVVDELGHYSFKVDQHTGEVLPVLADRHNHTIDALRYAVEGLRKGLATGLLAAPMSEERASPNRV